METETDFRVRDLGRTTLTLRRDLVFTPRSIDGQAGYLVEDTLNSKFFRIGAPEYTFISLLDGQTTISDALRGTLAAMPDCSLSEQDAAAICKWLVDTQLAYTDESVTAGRLIEQGEKDTQQRGWRSFNPLFIRAPLFDPDRFFAAITPWFGWLFSRWAVIVWAIVVSFGAYCVWDNSARFVAETHGLFAPNNWVWLGLSWILLKFVHEISHGVVCKKFGGTVREAGAIFLFFSPVAYVDVTSSWRFRSKWERIYTAAAGMYTELLIAAVAAIIWSSDVPGALSHVLFNVVLMASLTTILFNANPLMRFDGYYILSDLIELPNLYSSGQQVLRTWARRYLLGVETTAPQRTLAKKIFIPLYAVAACFWRVTVCLCLMVAVSSLFRGFGLLMALGVLVLFAGSPTVKIIKSLAKTKPGETPKWPRALAAGATAATLGYLLLAVVPWPGIQSAPGVVEFSPLEVVRADSSGFVGEIRVQVGQHVTKGQTLAVLINDTLQVELEQLKIDIEMSRAKSRVHEKKSELAALQAELSKRKSLQQRLHEKQTQVAHLTLRAPIDGNVIGRNLDNLLGVYIEQGAEILSLGDHRAKQIRVSIAQEDIDIFSSRLGDSVSIYLSGAQKLQSRLAEVEPRASVDLYDVSLSARMGGPLAVKTKTVIDESPSADQFELLDPRFTGFVRLSQLQAEQLNAGQRAMIAFRSSERTIGEQLYHLIARWVRDKVRLRVVST